MRAQSFWKKRRGFEPSQPDEIFLIREFYLQRISLAGLDQNAFGCPERGKLFAHLLQTDAEARGRKVQKRKLLTLNVGADFGEKISQGRELQEEYLVEPVRRRCRTVQQEGHSFLAG